MADEAQYSQIIAHVFAKRYKRGAREVVFDREEIVDAAQKLGLPRPKNIGDVVYSFRFRKAFPDSIKKTAPKGLEWILRKAVQVVTGLCLGSNGQSLPIRIGASLRCQMQRRA
jgi:hypothetical protein